MRILNSSRRPLAAMATRSLRGGNRMRRTLFTQDHEDFRLLVRDYLAREVVPEYEQWREAGLVPRELFTSLGKLGIIGTAVPEEFGGGGQDDYRYNVVLQEECARAGV